MSENARSRHDCICAFALYLRSLILYVQFTINCDTVLQKGEYVAYNF